MKPKFYHWILLVVCVLFALIEGVLDAVGGASPSSPAHKIDDIVVRLLGIGLATFSILIFTRKNWAFIGLILFFIMSAMEVVVTYRFTSTGSERVLEFLFNATGVFIFFGIPMALLVWLRHVFTRSNKSLQATAAAPASCD